MSKPTFVCVHGAWHSPECFDHVRTILSARGYDCICPSLPSTGRESYPPNYDFKEDIEAIRAPIIDLVKDKDVIVVLHSYGGIPGGQALEGLDKESCNAKGLTGGVTRIIYIVAFIVPEGFQHSPPGTRDNMIPVMKTDFETGTVTVDPVGAKALLYQDLDDDAASEWIAKLRPQSLPVYWSKTTFAAWRHIPTTYVITKKDIPTTVAAVHYLIATAKASGPHKIDNIIERDVGHSPFLSQPEWTVEMLLQEAARAPVE